MATCPHTAPKFRDNAVTAIQYDSTGLSLWFREVKRNAEQKLETIKLHNPVYLAWADVSPAIYQDCEGARYGMKVRFERQLAEGKDVKNPYRIDTKMAAAVELRDHYASGTDSWSLATGGGGSLSADTRALIIAIQRALGLEAEAAEEAVRAMSAADRDAMRVDEEIKPHLDAIYAERARNASGTEDLKAKLRALRA